MNKILRHLIVFILLIFSIDTDAQTFESLNGPLESNILEIIIHSDTVYVLTDDEGGLFSSHIDSINWLFSSLSYGEGAFRQGVEGVQTFEIGNNGEVYVGGTGIISGYEIFKQSLVSEDYGKNWVSFDDILNYCYGIYSIIKTELGSLNLGCGNGTFRFDEEIELFEPTELNLGGASGKVNGFYEWSDSLVTYGDFGFQYSIDDGENWFKSGFDSTTVNTWIRVDTGFFLGTVSGIYFTESLTDTLIYFNESKDLDVNSLGDFGDILLLGTSEGLMALDRLSLEIKSHLFELYDKKINDIETFSNEAFIGTSDGLYLCNKILVSCDLIGVPSSSVGVQMMTDNQELIVGTSNEIHRYFLETNRWDTLTISLERPNALIQHSPDSIFSISREYFLACSFNEGSCDSTRIDNGNIIFDLVMDDFGQLYLASNENVFISVNYGASWDLLYTNPSRSNRDLFVVSDSLLFINTESGLIRYHLIANEYNTIGFEESGINDYFVTSDGTLYVTAFFSVHRSSDFGSNWVEILRQEDLDDWDILLDIVYDESRNKIYVIEREGRIYVSDDQGVNWGVNTELSPTLLREAEIDEDGTLYVGTRKSGVYKTNVILEPPITISNEPEFSSNIQGFMLEQNYPNPFNPSTNIPFNLDSPSEINLELYNVFGQKVFTQNGGYFLAGRHVLNITLSGLSSGVYFARVRAGDKVQTIRMTLIK